MSGKLMGIMAALLSPATFWGGYFAGRTDGQRGADKWYHENWTPPKKALPLCEGLIKPEPCEYAKPGKCLRWEMNHWYNADCETGIIIKNLVQD